MATLSAMTARGKVLRVESGQVVFQPAGTNYELLLSHDGEYGAPFGTLVEGVVRAVGRKIWTVPSGGNFIEPIFGRPRIIQGRVRQVDADQLLLHAGCPIHITLPKDENAFDLDQGQIALGRMVNLTVLPGARFELVRPVG